MKNLFASFLILFAIQTSAQNFDSCASWKLPYSQDVIYFKNLVYQDSISVKQDFFRNRIVLYSQSPSVKLIGYSVVSGCNGCDIIGVNVCGEKMDNASLELLLRYASAEGGNLAFANINVEKNGKRYLARPFIVYFKK